jgi:adenine-specific DNA-methyltransferase
MTTDTSEKGLETLIMRHMTGTTAYKLKGKRPGSGESREVNVDLLETLNWLIGLTVRRLLEADFHRLMFVTEGV